MLVLTRRVGEKVVIAEHVHVMVVGIAGNQVRLGIEAPKGTPWTGSRSTGGDMAQAATASK
jgi:carbon storage regulator CsrA